MVFPSSSKRNIRIRHNRPGVLVRTPCTAARVPSALAELHTVDDDLRHIALASIIHIIAARLDASLDGDLTPLPRVLTDYLGGLLPCDAGDEVRLLVSVRALASVNRQREFCARLPALRVSHLRIACQASDSYEVVHWDSSFGNFINTIQIVLPLRFPKSGCLGIIFKTSAMPI